MIKTRKPGLPYIPARHNRLVEELFYWLLVRWPTWTQFDRVWLKIEGPLPIPEQGPLICYLNHPSWWDGYAAFWLHREVFKRRFQNYLMMDEQQMRNYSFFARVGVFSVDRSQPRRAAASVSYIGRLLAERRDRCLWIFPQGMLTPNEQRPIEVLPGLAHIVKMAGGAMLWPVALRFEFRNEQRPEAFIRAGPAHHAPATSDSADLTVDVQQRLTAVVDALRDDVISGQLDGYRVLLHGRPGVNRLFDAAATALGLRRAAD